MLRGYGATVLKVLRAAVTTAILGLALAFNTPRDPKTTLMAAPAVSATRLPGNPLITTNTSASLGDNVNGPTVVRAPAWVGRRRGRYYLYFAHHMGAFIRLAYADRVTGPWTVYEPGVLQVRDTAFFRPQPDPAETLDDFYTHVASPEIDVDPVRQRVVMWFHGWWTDGQQWPSRPGEARAWASTHGYGQFTQVAESSDGLHFQAQPNIIKTSYLRIFRVNGSLYGMARLGRLLRANDTPSGWEIGPDPFKESPYAGRIRHVAVVVRGQTLYVFFTGIGDAPERIMLSRIDLKGDWDSWKASDPVEVLRPETAYECGNLPDAPSEGGDVRGRVRQMRDPFVFEENGRMYLFYTICGEQGIAAAELTIR